MNVLHVVQIFFVAERTEKLMRNDLGKSDDRVERGTQFMAHIGEKLALRVICHLGLVARLDQFSLGCSKFSYIRVNRDNCPVRHCAAADLQDASSWSHAFLGCRYIAIERLETSGGLGRGVVATEVATHRLEHQDVAKGRTDREVRRQFEQFAETGVPCDQPPPAVKDAQTLADIFKRALEQPSFGTTFSPKRKQQKPREWLHDSGRCRNHHRATAPR